MKILLIFLILFVFSCVNSQNVHSFLLCKTNDEKIDAPIQLNYFKVKNLFEDIAESLGLPYIEHSLIGKDFNEKKFNDLFLTSKFNGNDIVLVYISTHGSKNFSDKDDFPNVDVPNSIISSYKTFTQCVNLKPKNIFFIVEACSGYSKLDNQRLFLFQSVEDIKNSYQQNLNKDSMKKNIKELFEQNYKFIVCSGQPGMDTWATDQGSIFTNCFVKAFKLRVNSNSFSKITWDEILKKAKDDTYAKTKKTTLKHYPVWKKYNNSENLISQSLQTPTSFVKFVIDCNKKTLAFLLRNKYSVKLSVYSDKEIDSVTYFMHYTMEQPTVTLPKKWPFKNYLYTIGVWGEYEIKAVVYFTDGTYQEIFGDIVKNKKVEF